MRYINLILQRQLGRDLALIGYSLLANQYVPCSSVIYHVDIHICSSKCILKDEVTAKYPALEGRVVFYVYTAIHNFAIIGFLCERFACATRGTTDEYS